MRQQHKGTTASLLQLVLLVLGMVGWGAGPAWSQLNQGEIPNAAYWQALALYHGGEFVSARRAFQDAAGGAIRGPEGRWVDSICFHTMLGECEWQLGNPAAALEQYTAALKLYAQHANWMLPIDFPANISAATGRPVTWGRSSRNTQLGQFPERFMLLQETVTATPADAGGNFSLVTGKQAVPIRAAEIARCTALAQRRRRELLGPVSPRDPFTDLMQATFARRAVPPNSWAVCWADVHLGLAYAAQGKVAQAVSELDKGITAGGTLDHHLTSAALLERGHLTLYEGKFAEAQAWFLEATYSAAQFDLFDDIEEGLRYALLCWQLQNRLEPFPPLAPALKWASANRLRKLEVALLLLAADHAIFLGDAATANNLLASAQKSMLRTELATSRLGSRWQFGMARLHFSQRNLAEGGSHLATALKFQRNASPWLFQIGLTGTLVAGGTLAERDAAQLFSEVLRDPGVSDWGLDPLDALAVSSSAFPAPYERWFQLAVARMEPDQAMEIADRLKRHRFYATLPMGGRLLALRWLLEAPPALLTPAAQQQRQDLLVKYPAYAQASQQAEVLQQELATLPLVAPDDDVRKKQTELYGQLAAATTTLEVLLRNIALRREAAEYSFPPTLNVKQLQTQIPPRTLVLAFAEINGDLYGYALGRERTMLFPLEGSGKLKADLVSILKAWGLDDRNQLITAKDLANDTWLPAARRLVKALTNGMKDDNWANFEELVVVPDGFLWYVPWEALPLTDDPAPPLLIEKLRVRIVPTLALAAPDPLVKQPLDRAALVAGKLSPRDELSVSQSACDKLEEHFPHTARLLNNIPAPSSLLLSQADQLVVYHDLGETGPGAYDWAPCPVDKARPGSQLAEWFALPWQGPRQVILPGFHTAAEASLRRGGSGNELFLTSCALLASGTRTLLVSRWRNGGQASYALVREFAVESPFTSAAAAWQRSVQLVRAAPLDAPLEPRVQNSEKLEGLTTSHPVFWAGYLLLDTAAVPPGMTKDAVAAPAPPAAVPPPPAAPKKPAPPVPPPEPMPDPVPPPK
jgi:hypothetical protein